jgi:glyoxylase-like metal-dependent hydrolase (beta-lactamase superfamily II)
MTIDSAASFEQRPDGKRRASADDLSMGDNVFHLNHNIAPSGAESDEFGCGSRSQHRNQPIGVEMGKLTQVADGVWVRQSEWVWTNSIAVRGEDGLILIDPGIDGSELSQLTDDLDRLDIPVVAGFSTHPHWDHLLWHPRFGDVPRYATPAAVEVASQTREQQQAGAAEEGGSGIPLDLIALVTPLPADGGPVPGEIIEHQAHAVGHAAVLLADRGVLLAGDMLSDILIPLFDSRQDDQVGAYETALARLDEAASHVDVVVPGHGAVAEGPEVAARLAADHAYIDALRRGEEPVDARLDVDWMAGIHQSNLEQVRGRLLTN